MNRYFYRVNPNSASICTTKCASLNFAIAATNDNMCCKSDLLSKSLIDQIPLTRAYPVCDNAIAPNGTDSTNAPFNYGNKVDDSLCAFPCRVPTGGTATEACGNNVDALAGNRISLYISNAKYVAPAPVSPRFPMNACVPMLKIVLLCNAICHDFSNRRRVCSDVGRMTFIDHADRRTTQDVVEDEQWRGGRVGIADHGRDMDEIDAGSGIWDRGFGLLEKARQGWLVVVTEVLDAGLYHCLQAVAASQVYNANHDETNLCLLGSTIIWPFSCPQALF
jgi:hypothetical protein